MKRVKGKSVWIKRLIILFSALFISAILINFAVIYLDKGYYKSILLKKISSYTEYNISFKSADINLFPNIRISMNDAGISSKENKAGRITAAVDRLNVYFTWLSIFNKKFAVDEIELIGSRVVINSSGGNGRNNKKGFFSSILKILNRTDIPDISLKNAQIDIFLPKKNITYKFFISELDSVSKNKGLSFYLKGAFYTGKLYIKGDVEKKRIDWLAIKNKPVFSPINFKFNIFYDNDLLKFNSIHVSGKGITDSTGFGSLEIKNDIILKLNFQSEYIKLKPLIDTLILFLIRKDKKKHKRPFRSEIFISSKRLEYSGYKFTGLECGLKYSNRELDISLNKSKLFNGDISCKGRIIFKQIPYYNFNISLKNLNVKDWISAHTDENFITGRIDSEIIFNSKGRNYSMFKKSIKSHGRVVIHEGKLFGYVDLLKPLYDTAKLTKIFGKRESITGFNKIEADFDVKNKIIRISNMKISGKKLDAIGEGEYYFNGDINFRVIVSVAGIVGKIVRVPIVYYGRFLKKVPIIDPFWLGKVYINDIAGLVLDSKTAGYIRNFIKKRRLKLRNKKN